MKKKIIFGGLLVGLMIFLSSTATLAKKPVNLPNNGNSHNKVTGGVEWFSGGIYRYASFEAHDTTPVRGLFRYWDDNGNTFDVNVSSMTFYSNSEVCMSGETVNATGAFTNKKGDTRYWVVKDGGEPEEDFIRGRWNSNCATVKEDVDSGDFAVTAGNLVVHTNLCEVYDLDVESVNSNLNYKHNFEITFCPNEEPSGEGSGVLSGPETVSDIYFDEGTNKLSFRSEYDSNSYTWYPSFTLEGDNTLTFHDGYGIDNVHAATGTWSMHTE